jgi:hypothetical protein
MLQQKTSENTNKLLVEIERLKDKVYILYNITLVC